MRFAEIFKIELFSKYGQKAGCYINEIYDIIYYSGCETFFDVAYYLVNECGYFGELSDHVKMYINYAALGRDLELNREIYDTGKGIFEIPL